MGYSKRIIAVEMGKIIHKDGFYMARQWSYPRNLDFFSCNLRYQRTSDSLNEGLPIKMTREKFQRKWYFFYEKDSRFNPRLIHKSRFLIGQVPIEKYGLKTLFLLFNIYKIEKVLLKCFPPRDQTNPFAYSCSFTFHTSYKNGMIGHGGGGNDVKMLKNALL